MRTLPRSQPIYKPGLKAFMVIRAVSTAGFGFSSTPTCSHLLTGSSSHYAMDKATCPKHVEFPVTACLERGTSSKLSLSPSLVWRGRKRLSESNLSSLWDVLYPLSVNEVLWLTHTGRSCVWLSSGFPSKCTRAPPLVEPYKVFI